VFYKEQVALARDIAATVGDDVLAEAFFAGRTGALRDAIEASNDPENRMPCWSG